MVGGMVSTLQKMIILTLPQALCRVYRWQTKDQEACRVE